MTTSDVRLSSPDLFLYAIADLGGGADFIDVEDAYIRMYELAPSRYSWRKRPDLPNFKTCAKGQQEAEARRPHLLIKDGAYKRRLSADGHKWLEKNQTRLTLLITEAGNIPEPKTRKSTRAVKALRASPVFRDWKSHGAISPEKWKIAQVLHCSPDSEPAVWIYRVDVLKSDSQNADDLEVFGFLEALVSQHSDWFIEGNNGNTTG